MKKLFDSKILSNTNNMTIGINEMNKPVESYFTSSLNFITESRKSFCESSKNLYKSLSESNGDYKLVHESFYDFYNDAIKIIDKFIKYIKSLVDRFITYLFEMIKSEKFIKKNKNKFKDFTKNHEFDIEGYYYTFDDIIPLITASSEFKEDLFDINDVKNDIKNVYERFNNKLQDDFFDLFRATVLGMDGYYITAGDYATELFRVYRNGADAKDNIIVTSNVVNNSLYNFLNYTEIEKSIKNTQKDVERQYNQIKTDISNMTKINFGPGNNITAIVKDDKGIDHVNTIDSDAYKYLNLFIKAKVGQVEQMCNIHTLAFSAKLDALREQFMQDKTILYKTLNRLNVIKG